MQNDLIFRDDVLEYAEMLRVPMEHESYNDCRAVSVNDILAVPSVDAEVVRHEGNTTFITTDNLDAYADRVIIRQGNWCKVYYRDSDDAEVEG